MKLAEALALRSDAQKRLAQLEARAVGAARYQEGEEPAEDATALLAQDGGRRGRRRCGHQRQRRVVGPSAAQ